MGGFRCLLFIFVFLYLVSPAAAANNDDVFNMDLSYNHSNYNYTYQPSPFVQAFHSCPHINERLEIVQNPKFYNVPSDELLGDRKSSLDPEFKAKADAYWRSLLAFPILLGCIGLLALVCLDLGIDGYFDCCVPKLGPKPLDEDDMTITCIALNTHANEVSRKNWLTYFIIAVFISMIGTNFVFFGNAKFDVGYKNFKEQIGQIATDLFVISTGVESLFSDLSKCADKVDDAINGGCPEAASVPPLIDNLKAQLFLFSDQVSTIGDYVLAVNDEIAGQVKQKDTWLYTLYALSMAMLIVFGSIAMTRKQLYMKYTVYAAQFAIVCLTAEGTFMFMLMMYFSDFCMDPMTSVYESMNGLGIIQQTAKYYGFCRGLNPIHRNLAESYSVRDSVGYTLVDLFDYTENPDCLCRSDRDVIDSYRFLQDMHDEYENLAVLMDCPTVHAKWLLIYERSLCHNTITGLLILWVNGWFKTIGLCFFLTRSCAVYLASHFMDKVSFIYNKDLIFHSIILPLCSLSSILGYRVTSCSHRCVSLDALL